MYLIILFLSIVFTLMFLSNALMLIKAEMSNRERMGNLVLIFLSAAFWCWWYYTIH